MMQLKTSSLIARKFTGYVSGLLLLLSILLNWLFFSSRYRWENNKLKSWISQKPLIKIFNNKNRKPKALPFVPLFSDIRSVTYDKQIEEEFDDNAVRRNISIINDNYIMYIIDSKTKEIKFTHIQQQIHAQERLLRMSLMFILVFSLLTYLLSHIFVKSSFYRVNMLLKYVQWLHIHNLDTKVPLIWPNDDEIQIIANKLQESLDTIKSQTDNLKHFISYASHELKTPLMSMNALMDVGEKTGKYDLVKDKIKNSIHTMNNLIEQLLSQLKQQNEIDNWNNKENISMISDIALEVINENKLLFPTHNFKLNQSKANISVQMNKENLKTILHNIIQNACKYSKETSTVIITIDPAYISIQDEWMGIKQEDLEKIRWEFYRANHGINWHGLWLSLVKKIIDQHGWNIDVKSEVGKWTEFIVYYNS